MKKYEELPGPRGLSNLKWALEIKNDPLVGMEKMVKAFGPTFLLKHPRKILVVTDPEVVKRVLKENHQNYHKGQAYAELGPILGKGLVTAEGKEWRAQRRIAAPEFNHKRLAVYFEQMKNICHHHLEQVKDSKQDIASLYNEITFDMAAQIFFGQNLGEESLVVKDAIHVASEITIKRAFSIFKEHRYLPLKSNKEYDKAVNELNRVVFKLIDEYLANPDKNPNSLLNRLLKAVENDEDKNHFTRQLLRDEVMTLLLAGHETTANTLMWTTHHILNNPEVYEKIMQEQEEVLGGREVEFADVPKLKYLKATVQESMRISPVVPFVSRLAMDDDELCGYKIKKGTNVMLMQWLFHRDPRFFAEPLKFRPERFLDPVNKIDEYTYFPFAAGPRKCIGSEFSLLESAIILSNVFQNFSLKKVPGFEPKRAVGITMFSSNGLSVDMQRKENLIQEPLRRVS